MEPGLLAELNKAFDFVVLKRDTDGTFHCIGHLPEYAPQVFSDALSGDGRMFDVGSVPFLEAFAEQSLEHWDRGGVEILWSGPWMESDGQDNDHLLQAAALTTHSGPVLVIMRNDRQRDSHESMIQHARENLLLQRYLESEIERRTQSIREREEEIVFRLICVTNYRHEETGAHIRRIGLYAEKVAQKLGWGDIRRHKIKLAAPMHDIGKVGIPDGILLKSGRLSVEEFEVMKQHTVMGGRMLEDSSVPLLQMGRDIALSHHENWNGSGYPNGLAGEEIPLAARITSICDVYDALVHHRLYRAALSEEKALAIMNEMHSSGKFDPEIFEVFMDILPEVRDIRDEVRETDPDSFSHFPRD